MALSECNFVLLSNLKNIIYCFLDTRDFCDVYHKHRSTLKNTETTTCKITRMDQRGYGDFGLKLLKWSHVSIGLFCLWLMMETFFYHSVTGLNLWGVLVATGAVCIVYCTLVGTTCIIMSRMIIQVWLYLKLLNHQQTGSLFYNLVSSNYLIVRSDLHKGKWSAWECLH